MQIGARQNQSKEAILRDILHIIAANPDPGDCISLILQTAQTVIGALSGHFLLFDGPYRRISIGNPEDIILSDDDIKTLIAPLSEGFHLNPLVHNSLTNKSALLIAPIRVRETTKGALWFLLDKAYELSPEISEILLLLIDAVYISVANAHTIIQSESAKQLTISLLNSISDPLLVLDEDYHIRLMNPAAETVFNTSTNQAKGKLLRELIGADALALMAEGGDAVDEWAIEDGKKVFMPRLQAIRKSTSPDIEGWVLALRDISRFKKLNRNQAEFMRIVSHDLRSPLTSMQGFASMLELGLVGELNEKQAHFVEKILSGITQMTALVDNIQDAGRYDPETGFYEMSRSQCDLAEMVNRILQNHLVPAEKQELSISVSVTENVPIINADVNMLERAVTNLVDNAIKYTPNGGKIDVSVKRQNEELIISVKDSGLGINPEHQKHLFERHVRIARQEHKKIKGSGLGLFIVRSVAQRHGGDAWVESEEGKGSAFFISIPLEGPNLIVPNANN